MIQLIVYLCNVDVLWLNPYSDWVLFWFEGYHTRQLLCNRWGLDPTTKKGVLCRRWGVWLRKFSVLAASCCITYLLQISKWMVVLYLCTVYCSCFDANCKWCEDPAHCKVQGPCSILAVSLHDHWSAGTTTIFFAMIGHPGTYCIMDRLPEEVFI